MQKTVPEVKYYQQLWSNSWYNFVRSPFSAQLVYNVAASTMVITHDYLTLDLTASQII